MCVFFMPVKKIRWLKTVSSSEKNSDLQQPVLLTEKIQIAKITVLGSEKNQTAAKDSFEFRKNSDCKKNSFEFRKKKSESCKIQFWDKIKFR